MSNALTTEKKRVTQLPGRNELWQVVATSKKSDTASLTSASDMLKFQKQVLDIVKQRQDIEIKGARFVQQQMEKRERALKSQKGDGGTNISDLIKTSRVSISGGGIDFMPLVGKLTGVLGELSTPITAATGAILLLEQAAQHAAAEMRAFRAAQLTSGGTQYEVAVGRGIGRYVGMSGEDVAKSARSFADRITSDPYAQSTANRLGISPDMPGPNGKIDKLEGLLRFIDKLRQLSDAEAIRAARATGTEDFLPLRDLTDRNYEALKAVSRAGGAAMTPENLMRQANRDAGNQLRNQMGQDIYDGMGRAFRNDVDAIGRHLIPGMGEAGAQSDREMAEMQRRRQSQNGGDRHTTALEENNGHLSSLNQILRQGMYGGGERARGAVPGAVIGAGWATKQYLAQSHALGAFSL